MDFWKHTNLCFAWEGAHLPLAPIPLQPISSAPPLFSPPPLIFKPDKTPAKSYKIIYLILIPTCPHFYRMPLQILLLLRMHSINPLPKFIIYKVLPFVAPDITLASVLMSKNKMPPPTPIFLEKFWMRIK